MSEKILITGAFGQLGTELSTALADIYGTQNIIISDIRPKPNSAEENFVFETLDVLDAQRLAQLIDQHQITQIYHLAALLSANGEKDPAFTWHINMQGTLNVFQVAVEKQIHKVYYPSSIAVFGDEANITQAAQSGPLIPDTVYGISKVSGEIWANYYYQRYKLDVRSLRYPGIISYTALPGGGTTDYAVDIFHQALEKSSYTCFLNENTRLPMIYMPDAIRATLELMHAEASKISVRTSYNLASMSFTPDEIYQEIHQYLPDFSIDYQPDFRQKIANSWPQSINDFQAQTDWDWKPQFSLSEMVKDMLDNLSIIKIVVCRNTYTKYLIIRIFLDKQRIYLKYTLWFWQR